jgi:integrase
VFYENLTGSKTCISTKTKIKREAFRFLSTFENELKQRNVRGVIPIGLKDFSFQYLKYSESIHKPKTSKSLKTLFNQLNEFLGNVELSDITAKNIKDFLLLKSNISVHTAQKYLAHIRCAFNKAITDNYLITNPCSRIDNYKIPEKQPLFFSELDYEILFSNIDDNDLRNLVSFAILTGLRQVELLTLTWDQIDFKTKILTLDNRNYYTKSKR